MTEKTQKLKPLRIGNYRHGHSGHNTSGTYVSWLSMKTRCKSDNRHNSYRYKSRGISMDQRWINFENFLNDMGERPEGTTLDRIDNDKGYSKDNCKWSTPTEQARNRRNSVLNLSLATEIAVMMLNGGRATDISKAFGISESLPRGIIKGRCWKDALKEAKRIVSGG